MLRLTRPLLTLPLLLCACESDGGHGPGVRAVDQDHGTAQQTPGGPASSGDGGVPRVPTTSVIGNSTDGRPKDAGLGGLDAGNAADGSPDASDGASEAAVISPYACVSNSDCQIKNIFSCCGYFPRCANTAANFAPPDCSQGQIGVCSLPLIDHCECRQRVCVDVQSVAAN